MAKSKKAKRYTHEVFVEGPDEWVPCEITKRFMEERYNLSLNHGGNLFGCSGMFIRVKENKNLTSDKLRCTQQFHPLGNLVVRCNRRVGHSGSHTATWGIPENRITWVQKKNA